MPLSTFLVEDRPDVRDTLIHAMERLAQVKFVAHSETEQHALQWLGANDDKWDLAIVDLFLKEGTGLGILKKCQARSPRQKVVVLTSYLGERVLHRCRQLGADEVFDKAHDVERLVEFCLEHAANLDNMSDDGLITQPGDL